MKHRVLASLAGVVLIAGGAAIWGHGHLGDGPHTRITPASPSKATANSDLSLTIPAIRSRHYAASAITTTQPLGDQGGYRNAVVSFVSDGLTEYALQSTPDTPPPAGGYPVIVLMHGYINPSQYQTTGGDYHDFIAAWAKAGFVVLKPDYRGNGSSQGTATSGHYSPAYTYDMLNLIASLKTYSLVNGGRIGIVGHSMGGHVALNVAVSSADVKATVLANGVVASMYDLFYRWPHSPAPSDKPTAVVTGELQQLLAQHGTPKSNPGFYTAASAINYVRNIGGPVQLDADTGDTTVPYAFSQSLDGALTNAKKSVILYSYPGNDHQLSNSPTHAEVIQRSTQFFQQNL